MGVSCRCLRLAMTKQLSNDRKALAKCYPARGECMPKVMNTNVWEIGQFPNTSPRLLHVSEMLALKVASDHVRIVPAARD